MAEDVKPEVIKKTQESLGKFIKKPVLTEKLLKKPPFRFLHDICTSVMKETGFFGNVLNSAEDKFENIKNKEGKIEFLQKIIAAVESASGIKLAVKPNKVVAGLEPTKTNEFLQAIGIAIERQQADIKSSKVSQLTKSKTTKKLTKEVKEEPPDKRKTSKKILENGLPESNIKNKTKEISDAPSSPKKKHSNTKVEDPRPKIEEENFSRNGVSEEKLFPEKEEIILKKLHNSEAGESENVPEGDSVKVNSINAQGDHNTIGEEEIVRDRVVQKEASGNHKHRRSVPDNILKSTNRTTELLETNGTLKTTPPEEKTEYEKLNTFNRTDNILSDQTRGTSSPSSQITLSKKGTSLLKEGTLISRPRTRIRPLTARPASARPAAPRIRDRGEIPVAEEVIKPVSEKVQVIEEKDTSNEIEDENLISLVTTNDILIEEPLPILPPTATSEKEHGHLVEQILEVQRELEDNSRFAEEKTSGKTEIEWNSKRDRESTNREIAKLRANIQMLTRTANPLGKLLDFFQEDIDIIQKELESWIEKNKNFRLQIAHEKSITDQFIEPLKTHLKELQLNIDEQSEQINAVKANIIRNNEKIQKLLTGG